MKVANQLDPFRVRPHIVCFRFLLALTANACTSIQPAVTPSLPDTEPAAHIEAAALLRHVEILASDAYEGRKPGTNGEVATVDYLVNEFERSGLEPGNPDGSYVQEVPLLGVTSDLRARLTVRGEPIDWVHKRDFVGGSGLPSPATRVVDSELVFVGYGVVAPEYDWDDYKGADVRGKTIVVLMNDPQVADPADPARLDPTLFKGVVKTYYATGRHKREAALARGAVARITIHEAEHAGWPFSVAIFEEGREELRLKNETEAQFDVEMMIPLEAARELVRRAGMDLDALRVQARRRDFKPVALDARADFDVTNSIREVRSKNVVARTAGSDPKLKDEVVIYTAHWDHLGRDPTLKGDQIYHGALDNASGVAALLEIARSYAALPKPPARSVLFIATTAEESGLLGAKHYATHPLYPLARTLVDLNLDIIGAWGRTRDFQITGWGESNLDSLLTEVGASQGKHVIADQTPELGVYYRQDAFEFARAGVPSVHLRRGIDFIDKPPAYGKEIVGRYLANDYHQVTDIVRPDFDFSGGAELAEFAFAVGHRLAQGGPFPQWLRGTEFKAKRDSMMNLKP